MDFFAHIRARAQFAIARNEYLDLPIHKKFLLLSISELAFYKQASPLLNQIDLVLFPKMRLEDVVYISKKVNEQMKYGFRGTIKSRHIDFMVCDHQSRPICGIEVDGTSHNLPSVKRQDEYKNNLFRKMGLPLIRIAAKSSYSETEILKVLHRHIKNLPLPVTA